MTRARFIVLEGIDGTGKTTQSALLASWLRGLGRDVVETREPTDGAWGRRYRAWARGELEASAEEVLGYFVEDRREHVTQVIEPALSRGCDVVCDRYEASTQAYQSAQGLDRSYVRERLEAHGFPRPDLAIWLRLSPALALKRLGTRELERFEREAFLERVDAEYARLDLIEVDASGSVDEVQAELRRHVQPDAGDGF